jgi:hypothetical protein
MTRPKPKPKKKKKARKVVKKPSWRDRAIKRVPDDVGLINDA